VERARFTPVRGDAVTVTITDRGPYVKGRCIDLSKAGASALDLPDLFPLASCLW
jgi:Lytic transglycolase